MYMNIGYHFKDTDITSGQFLDQIEVRDFQNLVIQVVAYNTANITIYIEGSLDENVDFNQPSAPDNAHAPVQVVDLNTGATIDGTTGISITTDSTKLFEVNVNALRKLGIKVTKTSGSVDIRILGTNVG